jgi:hypothetical protein
MVGSGSFTKLSGSFIVYEEDVVSCLKNRELVLVYCLSQEYSNIIGVGSC